LISSFIFISGLLIGSFLNVIIYRIPVNKSIVTPRSSCTDCGHQIAWWENIPVISYLLLGGKCFSCKTKISIQYPIVELLTALLFYQTFKYFGLTLTTLFIVSYLSIIVAITFIDLDHYIIPNGLLIATLFPIAGIIFTYTDRLVFSLFGGLALGIGFLFIRGLGNIVFKKESMGMGDIKYAACIGLLLGWKVGIVAVALAFVSASIYTIALLPFKKLSLGTQVPFGPFLSLGVYGGIFWGTDIINWYLRYLV